MTPLSAAVQGFLGDGGSLTLAAQGLISAGATVTLPPLDLPSGGGGSAVPQRSDYRLILNKWQREQEEEEILYLVARAFIERLLI